MCLLVSQPATTKFDDDFIKGVYQLNSDGIGVMYADQNSLFINRMVPTTEKDFVQFFRENIEGRDCAWHARMKTHGHIDLTNCHPYQVISADEGYPLYLAHNGILAMGNDKDVSKSDTWHYIQDYLRPMLLKNPEFFLTEAFADIIGGHIGSGNKFILMDAYGNRVVINEDRGVQHEGAWLSNTYAWDTTGTVHDWSASSQYGGKYGYKSSFPKPYKSIYGSGLDDDEYDTYYAKTPKTFVNSLDDDLDELEDASKAQEFATFLFEALDAAQIKHDKLISWDDALTYYKLAGDDLAWDVVEAIEYGAYTQGEAVDELTYFSKVAA